jgi:hypothetical protein
MVGGKVVAMRTIEPTIEKLTVSVTGFVPASK